MNDQAATKSGRKLWRIAKNLLWLTLAWNVVEFLVAIAAGDAADSIALIGFGLDSAIESFAAAYALWAFRTIELNEEQWEEKERKVHRIVGATFILLAVYIVVEAAIDFFGDFGARTSVVGIVLASLSLAVMPLLGKAKLRNARRLGSRALAAEAKETIACAWLSATLLIGLAANALWGWQWLDAATALALVPWLVREGIEGLAGEEEDDDDDDDED